MLLSGAFFQKHFGGWISKRWGFSFFHAGLLPGSQALPHDKGKKDGIPKVTVFIIWLVSRPVPNQQRSRNDLARADVYIHDELITTKTHSISQFSAICSIPSFPSTLLV